MNRAATEDVRSLVWPVVSQVLRTGAGAERARRAGASTCSTTGSRRDAPRLDADNDGQYDDAGADDHGRGLAADRRGGDAAGVRRPARRRSNDVRGLGGLAGESYVDKDLRTLLGRKVQRQVQPALLRQRLARRAAGRRCGRRSTRSAQALAAAQGARPDDVAQHGGTDRLHPRA